MCYNRSLFEVISSPESPLGHTTQTTEMPAFTPRIRPEHLAWGVLLLAFAFFCVMCVTTTLGVHYFFFRSTVSMNTVLQVGRGTASMITRSDPIEEAVRSESRSLSSGTIISTPDGQTQAVIAIRDSGYDGQLIAAITVKPNTRLSFSTASQPRFEWSDASYYAELDSLSGEIDVFVAENLPREFRLDIQTVQGSWVSVSSSGRYTLNASQERIRLTNQTGVATLFAPDSQINRSVPEATEGSFATGDSEIVLSPAIVDLLENSSFEELGPASSNGEGTDSRVLPVSWACTNAQDDLPRGMYRSDTLEGRLTMHLVRAEGASSHGETRCIQPFRGQAGLDVSGYEHLSLRVTFYVDYQSLSTCGVDGSECPLMLKMDYLDINGIAREWIHGFYAWVDEQTDYPRRCATCALDHEQIYSKAWYTFESGNFIAELPADLRPSSILNVQFYASGHQYNVYVSEVALAAR